MKVKIVKETSSTVTVLIMALNRKMPVPRKDFESRVQSGLYEVVNMEEISEKE